MIDGVLQLDFPPSALAPAVGGPASVLVIGRENALLAPPLERLLAATDLSEIAREFNPLTLVGPSGSGKSLVAQGLARRWSERLGALAGQSDAVAYFTAADFGRERQAAELEDRLAAWRESLRGMRLVVIEDLERLRARATIQRELRETIDALVPAGGVVLVTAAREPFLSSNLDAGLRDRLVAGLTVRIERPGLAARRAMLAQAATTRGLTLDAGQLDQLAERECATPAHLIGRLNALMAQQLGLSASLPLVGRAGKGGEASTRSIHPSPNSSPRGGERKDLTHGHAHLKQILAVAARYFGVTQAAITSKSRRTSLVEARNVIVYLARRLTDLSYAEIGRALGGRDHTTIMHADRRLAERVATDAALQQAVDELERIVRV